MSDGSFAEAGLDRPRGLRRILVPFRHWLYHLLRPVFQRQCSAFQVLEQEIDGLRVELESLTPLVAQVAQLRTDAARFDFLATELQQVRDEIHRLGSSLDRIQAQVQDDVALGCDRTAIVRRLAVLEDHVEALLQQATSRGADSSRRRSSAA